MKNLTEGQYANTRHMAVAAKNGAFSLEQAMRRFSEGELEKGFDGVNDALEAVRQIYKEAAKNFPSAEAVANILLKATKFGDKAQDTMPMSNEDAPTMTALIERLESNHVHDDEGVLLAIRTEAVVEKKGSVDVGAYRDAMKAAGFKELPGYSKGVLGFKTSGNRSDKAFTKAFTALDRAGLDHPKDLEASNKYDEDFVTVVINMLGGFSKY